MAEAKQLAFRNKEKALETQLRKQHCRPLLKLVKMLSTDALQASFTAE